MALLDFPDIDVHYTTKKKTTMRRIEAEFGDGYTQRAADGLNTIRQVWRVVWKSLNDTDVATIEAFLDARDAHEAFKWTPPRTAIPLVWTCDGYDTVPSGHQVSNITATFRQEFDLTT